jgi:seryl-tRNA synthetase
MTIEEARQKTEELKSDIYHLVDNYVDETGLFPSIEVSVVDTYMNEILLHRDINVKVKAKL